MTDVGVAAKTQVNDAVADEIRVRLTLKRMSAAELARRLGVSQMYVWRRLEGRTAFDLNDLQKIATILDVPVMDLFQRVGTPNVRSDHLSPVGPQRRDPSRPAGTTGPRQRRPQPVRHAA